MSGGPRLLDLPAIADYPAFLSGWAEAAAAPRASDAPTVASTFAGAGGSSLGYAMAGFREVFATDWDATAMSSFRENFPGVPTWLGDIAELSAADMLAAAGVAEGELDVLDGSPPCQGFSTAGKRVASDPRNSLFREFAKLLRGARPRAFVMENVPGLVRGKMRPIFREMTRELKACGYRVSCRMVDAQWLGVPQVRRRMIWVGVREDVAAEPAHPVPLWRPVSVLEAIGDLLFAGADAASSGLAPFAARDAGLPSRSDGTRPGYAFSLKNDRYANEFRDAGMPSPTLVGDGPVVRVEARGAGWMAGRSWDGSRPVGAALPASGAPFIAIHRGMGYDGEVRDCGRPSYGLRGAGPPELWVANSGRDGKPVAAARDAPPLVTSPPLVSGSERGANPRYGKDEDAEPPPFDDAYAGLWDEVEPGGNAFDVVGKGFNNCVKPDPARPSPARPATQTGRGFATVAHWAERRALTVGEGKRLQSFPDGFVLEGSYSAQWRQIWNSVPPLMMRAVAEAVRGALACAT